MTPSINNAPNISEVIAKPEYDFLRTNPHLGDNIVLLTYGGSYAYGTNVETSDIDIRGVTSWTKREILLGKGCHQVLDNATDTTIYSFPKLIPLLTSVNPNTIELLGCKPEHYIIKSPIGQKLIDNASMFLSLRCAYSFGGYANAQLQRLNNKAARTQSQIDQEKHVLKTINNMRYTFSQRFATPEDNDLESSINLYVEESKREEWEAEIFADIDLKHYPLRDFTGMWAEMSAILKEFNKIGHRNQNAIARDKLGKHMMHLVRLYLMCFDILVDGKIVTYREKDRDLLMDIRNGKYLDERNQPTEEFMEMVSELENKLDALKLTSPLPKNPDYDAIDDFVVECHEMVMDGAM